MSNQIEYQNLIAFHPGVYVEEIIDEWNMTQQEFADRLGISSKTVSKIINGQDSVSALTAEKLAKLTGVSMTTWLNLQAQYDTKVAEIKSAQDTDENRVAKMIDLAYLKSNGFIQDKRYSNQEKISSLRRLFKVSSLSRLLQFNSAVSYRRSTSKNEEKSIVCSNAMLELATNRAHDATQNKYDATKLARLIPEMKRMTLEAPKTFYPQLVQALLNCGIVLEVLPTLTGARLNGATKKFKNGSVLLLVTDKNKYADIFWFSLVHELGHIYYEDFYSNREDDNSYRKSEEKADDFASNFFIPAADFNQFVAAERFTDDTIREFADRMSINPGIVVGRLQNQHVINYAEFNYLREKYQVSIPG